MNECQHGLPPSALDLLWRYALRQTGTLSAAIFSAAVLACDRSALAPPSPAGFSLIWWQQRSAGVNMVSRWRTSPPTIKPACFVREPRFGGAFLCRNTPISDGGTKRARPLFRRSLPRAPDLELWVLAEPRRAALPSSGGGAFFAPCVELRARRRYPSVAPRVLARPAADRANRTGARAVPGNCTLLWRARGPGTAGSRQR